MTMPRKTTKPDAPKQTPPAPYDPAPYQQARDDIRELIDDPLSGWTFSRRNRDGAYLSLLCVPLDLASAGFTVTIEETERGWCISVTRQLQPGRMLRLCGHAQSYAACLAQLATTAPVAIADVERRAKAETPEPEVAA